ncbi:MAG: tetratricopeptide repeat protein, partial [Fimbriimonadaceae bacterium]
MTLDSWLESASSGWKPLPLSLRNAETVEELVQRGLSSIRQDLGHATTLADYAARISRMLNDPKLIGLTLRLKGHTKLLSGRSRAAVRLYEAARIAFHEFPDERAATAIPMLQALSYVGDYQRVFDTAQEALNYFQEVGDDLRAARVEANLANALHRLDRLTEARDCFQRSIDTLAEHNATADLAIVMRNFGVVLMGLQDYESAAALYARARANFEAEGLTSLVLEVDLNHAYLLGRKGHLRDALVCYRNLQDQFSEANSFELGHCLLDQADFMLEIGLWTDAEVAARRAYEIFTELQLRFERGKAKLLMSVALLRKGHIHIASEGFKEARTSLRGEPNLIWQALARQAFAELYELKGWDRRAVAELKR